MKSKTKPKKKHFLPGHTSRGIKITYSLRTFITRMSLIPRYVVEIQPNKYQLITGEILTYRFNEVFIRGSSGVLEFKDILLDYLQNRQPEPLLHYLNFYGKLMKELRLGIFAKRNRFETKEEYYRLTMVCRKDNNHLFNSPPVKKQDTCDDGYVEMDESDFDLGDLTL